LTHPSEKYESQLGLFFPISGKIKKISKPPTRYLLYYIDGEHEETKHRM